MWRDNSRRVRTHEKNAGDAVRRLGTIIQSIICAQSGASIRLTVWKWTSESPYPGALPPMLVTFPRAFSPGPTDCPWVSEDVPIMDFKIKRLGRQRHRKKINRFNKQWHQLCTCITFFFSTFLSRFCTTTTWRCLISRFKEEINKERRNFISLFELGYGH